MMHARMFFACVLCATAASISACSGKENASPTGKLTLKGTVPAPAEPDAKAASAPRPQQPVRRAHKLYHWVDNGYAIFDTQQDRYIGFVPPKGAGLHEFVSPTGARIYASEANLDGIRYLDTATDRIERIRMLIDGKQPKQTRKDEWRFTDVAFSPSGEKVYFYSALNRKILELDEPTGSLRVVYDIKRHAIGPVSTYWSVYGDPRLSSDETKLCFSVLKHLDDTETPAYFLVILNLVKGTVREISAGPDHVRIVLAPRNPKDKRVYFVSKKKIFVVDTATAKVTNTLPIPGQTFHMLRAYLLRDDRILLAARAGDRIGWVEFDTAGGTAERTDLERGEAALQAKLSADRKFLYFFGATHVGSEAEELRVRVDLQTKQVTRKVVPGHPFRAKPGRIELSDDGKRIYFLERWRSMQVVVLDAQTLEQISAHEYQPSPSVRIE